MRELPCAKIEVDEIWGYVGKKQRQIGPEDSTALGDAWTFVAIDPVTKAVPCFHVGKRDHPSTSAFISDLSARMTNRIQLSSDAMIHYANNVEEAFGGEIDYGQIVKTYHSSETQGRYSPPEIQSVQRTVMSGEPHRISTSNGVCRGNARRETRMAWKCFDF